MAVVVSHMTVWIVIVILSTSMQIVVLQYGKNASIK